MLESFKASALWIIYWLGCVAGGQKICAGAAIRTVRARVFVRADNVEEQHLWIKLYIARFRGFAGLQSMTKSCRMGGKHVRCLSTGATSQCLKCTIEDGPRRTWGGREPSAEL